MRVSVLNERSRYSRMKRVVWQSWSVRALRDYDRRAMRNVGIRNDVGVDVIVLRRNVIAWIVSGHLQLLLKGRRKDGLLLIVGGDERLAED